MSKQSDTQPLGLALIRILTGAVIFSHGWNWLQDGSLDGALVNQQVNAALGDLDGLMHWWGDSVLLYHHDLTALALNWGAILIGACLALGALTRPAGLIACFLLFNAAVFGPEAQSLSLQLLIIPCLGCAIAGAGRDFGMDKIIDESAPGWLTWTKRRRGNGLFN
jgi:uncharacterized membrane protein YphA (DoxX/SURF4 family)